ncbi:MAG: FHA domain-containing protein [Sedimentisphaerales bacterium]|nr:FHA domain-containing protein [Sedimentisphaerales bacterium]
MRLLVKRGQTLVNDLRFSEGPVYIGRSSKSHVFLPDRSVSRQHGVLLTDEQGQWLIKDLDSANRTLVNGRPVVRIPLHEGDIINISDFTLEIHLDEPAPPQQSKPFDMGDTLVHSQTMIPSVYGKKTARQADHIIHIAPGRIQDLYQIIVGLCRLEDQESLLQQLNTILLKQMEAYHVWIGLRETTSGPLTTHGGISRGGIGVGLDTLIGRSIVKQAMQAESYILVPNVIDVASSVETSLSSLEKLRSAMAAPIMAPAGAYGVIYVDNGIDQPAYCNLDLDYLTMVGNQVAALVEHIG